MKEGGSLESFGSKVNHSTSTVYYWLDNHPSFSEARKRGMPLLHAFYEALGKTIASGQLRRLKSERPVLDSKGKIILDPVTGKPVMEREYEAATPGQSAWIFLCKNMIGYRDRKDIEVSGKDGGPVNFSNVSDDDLKAELKKLIEEAKKVL